MSRRLLTGLLALALLAAAADMARFDLPHAKLKRFEKPTFSMLLPATFKDENPREEHLLLMSPNPGGFWGGVQWDRARRQDAATMAQFAKDCGVYNGTVKPARSRRIRRKGLSGMSVTCVPVSGGGYTSTTWLNREKAEQHFYITLTASYLSRYDAATQKALDRVIDSFQEK